MKVKQAALSVLIAFTAGTSSAFVPIALRPLQLKTTRRPMTSSFDDFWRIPGKPANHPDHWNDHILELNLEEQELRREVARSRVDPLPEDTGDEPADEEPVEKSEATMVPYDMEGDARLNDLLEEARYLAEEVEMRIEEEQALYSSDEVEAGERPRSPVPLVTDPESILADQEFRSVADAESGPMAMGYPDDSEEERMRKSGEEAAKRFVEEAARMKAQETEAQEEMRQRGRLEAQRQKAEMARIRAQQEEARIKAEIEARIEAIEAAARMKEQALRRELEVDDWAWSPQAQRDDFQGAPVLAEEGGSVEAEKDRAPDEEEQESAPYNELDAAEEARIAYVEKMRAEANSRRQEQEMARMDARSRAEEEAKRVLAETARLRAEREEAAINAQAEARRQGIEAARRMKEESARRAEERNAELWAQEEARHQAKEDAIRRVEERERMMKEEQARMMQEEAQWRSNGNVNSEEGEGKPDTADAKDDAGISDDENDGRDPSYAISDVMRIIG